VFNGGEGGGGGGRCVCVCGNNQLFALHTHLGYLAS